MILDIFKCPKNRYENDFQFREKYRFSEKFSADQSICEVLNFLMIIRTKRVYIIFCISH